jgi:hypothetical protein
MRASTYKFATLVLMAVVPVVMNRTAVCQTALSAQQVVAAIRTGGISASPDRIEFLSGTGSVSESANLQFVSVTNGNAGTVKVKLRCQDRHECLPFYVLLHGADSVNGQKLGVRSGPVIQAGSPQNVVHNGDHATLVIETADSRIKLAVICMESGVPGQKIRVASPDRKHFYDAEIATAGLLKGSF